MQGITIVYFQSKRKQQRKYNISFNKYELLSKVKRLIILHVRSKLQALDWGCTSDSLDALRVSKADKMHKCLSIWINSKSTVTYPLTAQRTGALSINLHNCLSGFTKIFLYLMHDVSRLEQLEISFIINLGL